MKRTRLAEIKKCLFNREIQDESRRLKKKEIIIIKHTKDSPVETIHTTGAGENGKCNLGDTCVEQTRNVAISFFETEMKQNMLAVTFTSQSC